MNCALCKQPGPHHGLTCARNLNAQLAAAQAELEKVKVLQHSTATLLGEWEKRASAAEGEVRQLRAAIDSESKLSAVLQERCEQLNRFYLRSSNALETAEREVGRLREALALLSKHLTPDLSGSPGAEDWNAALNAAGAALTPPESKAAGKAEPVTLEDRCHVDMPGARAAKSVKSEPAPAREEEHRRHGIERPGSVSPETKREIQRDLAELRQSVKGALAREEKMRWLRGEGDLADDEIAVDEKTYEKLERIKEKISAQARDSALEEAAKVAEAEAEEHRKSAARCDEQCDDDGWKMDRVGAHVSERIAAAIRSKKGGGK